MKKIFILFFILLLTACKVGEFSEKRNRLHDMNRTNICEKDPSRCINGVPW